MKSMPQSVADRYSTLKSERGEWERSWQEIRDLVRPDTSDFQRQESPGQVRSQAIYDGTAPQALGELASGLQSFLTNPSDRWFEVGVEGVPQSALDDDAKLWLEQVSDEIYAEYSREASAFTSAISEVYLDLGAFGTAVIYQEWDHERRGLLFKSIPLADCYVEENSRGRVDVLYRRIQMNLRQLEQEFGYVPRRFKNASVVDHRYKFEVVHAVFPRKDRIPGINLATNKPFASIWMLLEDQYVMLEHGFDVFPYHVPRWSKLAGEIYGRSPALMCLPDIRMLNRMEYTAIKQLQKAVDPPVLLPNDGFILPLKTGPGSVNYREPGSEDWQFMEFKGQWPIALEITNQKRDFIRRCFAADWLRMEKEKVEMTAYEVADRRDEKLRFLAPMLGRIQTELLGPLVERSFFLKNMHRQLPDFPPSLSGQRLKVGYVSPAARAQLGMKAISMGRYIQELLPMSQIDPSILDIIDLDAVAQELADLRGASRKILRSPDSVTARRDARAQQEQAQQLVAMAEPATKAVKNLADAQSKGGI